MGGDLPCKKAPTLSLETITGEIESLLKDEEVVRDVLRGMREASAQRGGSTLRQLSPEILS